MDEIDYAQELEQLHRDEAIGKNQDRIRHERERLKMMQEKGIHNACKYCSEPLDCYDYSFCKPEKDWSCSEEYYKEKRALESGRTVRV